MATRDTQEATLAPLTSISKRWIALVAVLGLAALVFVEAVIHQLRYGLLVTDLASWGTQAGVTWGLYIGGFEWFAGMALGALAVTGYIRYRGIDQYALLARLGELLAVVGGLMAAFLIVIDLGRPERVIYVLQHWPSTVQHSPLAWDVTFVTMLIIVSVTMLALSLRRDFGATDVPLPRHVQLLKRALTLGYTPGEKAKLESMLRYMGAAVLILVVTAGMVPGWLFGVVGPQPGYYGKIQGVVFISGGIPAGIGAIAVSAFVVRRVYGLHERLPNTVFADLGKALAIFSFVYLIVLFNQFLPQAFPMAPLGGAAIADAMMFGALAPYFWTSIVLLAGTVLAMAGLYTYGTITSANTVVASLVVMFAVLIKKILAVLEPLMFPVGLPYEHGVYVPTAVEWVILGGAFVVGVLALAVAVKVVPLTSVTVSDRDSATPTPTDETEDGTEVTA